MPALTLEIFLFVLLLIALWGIMSFISKAIEKLLEILVIAALLVPILIIALAHLMAELHF